VRTVIAILLLGLVSATASARILKSSAQPLDPYLPKSGVINGQAMEL
jgi:hypothetical protein